MKGPAQVSDDDRSSYCWRVPCRPLGVTVQAESSAQYERSDDIGEIHTGYGTLHELFNGRHLTQYGPQNTVKLRMKISIEATEIDSHRS